jgi:hypothetical protein
MSFSNELGVRVVRLNELVSFLIPELVAVVVANPDLARGRHSPSLRISLKRLIKRNPS